jgi:site-specific DNA recombinase
MKAIILARVSTEEQMAEGQSIPAQLAKAREYVKRRNFEIASEYHFDESSTKDRRDKFERVIEEIRTSQVPIALIVETVDRLQRSFKESVLLDDFRKQGKLELHFIRENLVIHRNSNSSEIQRWDLAVFVAKSYVLQLSDNVKRSIDHKTKNGEWPGKAPYGYANITNEDGKKWIAPDPFTSKIVVKMFEWYASETYSMDEIRIKTKKEFGITTSKGVVDFILKNPFYYGEMLYNGKIYPHKYQSIISKQLFDKVQSVKAGFHKKPFKYAGLPLLYRGMLRCKVDGFAFSPEIKRKKSGKEYVYYHCTEYDGAHGTAWLREEELTKQFAEIIRRIAVPRPIVEKISQILKASHEGKVEYHNSVLSGLQAEYKRFQGRLDKMYEHYLDGQLPEEEYLRKRKEYCEKRDAVQSKMDALEKADENYHVTATYLLKLASRAGELFESSGPELKRQILKLVLQNCEVDGVSLCPTYRSPFNLMAEGAFRTNWLPGLDSNQGHCG